jgi:hypothetical protein
MKIALGVLPAIALTVALMLVSPPAQACNGGGNCDNAPGHLKGAPAPLLGAGLPGLAAGIGYGAYWLARRRRRNVG